ESSSTRAEILAQSETPATQHELQTSKLIEFPGVSRASIPQWRKELSERVREVHEKRAREDALEGTPATGADPAATTPQLELLPHTEAAPLNPLVAAALRRIDRAHEHEVAFTRSANSGMAAVAYASRPEFCGDDLSGFELTGGECSNGSDYPAPDESAALPQPERVHNLIVVPPRALEMEDAQTKPKPRRVITGELNDPALNYLDSILTTVCVEAATRRPAPTSSRLFSAIVDLCVVAALREPVAAAWELANGDWHDYRVAIVAGVAFSVMSFFYFTISTGLTGRTLGLRLFSLRVVDARTGLIPTGSQSAGRALIYILSLLTLGFASLFALLNPERQTAHDRLTHTAVILV
ncbi:MAG: RDD family protein, partial [Acidobacteriota bacterium]